MTIIDKIKICPIIIFSAIMIYVLAVSTYLLKYLPLRSAGDLSTHIPMIYFLKEYGFHSFVPNWYNGFTLFQFYPPLWSYFSIILYNIFGNYNLVIYASLIMIYLIGFFGIYLIGKHQKMDFINIILFFMAFFFNYITVLYVIRIGRFPELLGWALFIFFFYLIIVYKNKRLGLFAIFLPLNYGLLMLTNVYVFMLSSILFLSLFIIKSKKEKLILIVFSIITTLITSFWWNGFLEILDGGLFRDGTYRWGISNELLSFSTIISTNTVILILFILVFIFYIRENKNDFRFYLPLLILDILILSRLISFIPIFRNIPTSPYNILFLFVSIFLLLKTQNIRLKKFIAIGFIVLSIFSLFYTLNIELQYEYSELDKEFFYIFPNIEERFIILDDNLHYRKLGAYATILYNLSMPAGLSEEYLPVSLEDALNDINKRFINKDCSFKIGLKNLNVDEIVVKECNFAEECGFRLKYKTENLCLMELE